MEILFVHLLFDSLLGWGRAGFGEERAEGRKENGKGPLGGRAEGQDRLVQRRDETREEGWVYEADRLAGKE